MSVGRITVWGIGDTAVVKVAVEGKVSGELFLLGRVGYDPATRSVLVSDLRYTLESSSKMSSIKATLGAIRIRHALDEATGHGRLAVGEQLDRVKSQLATQLNRQLAPGVMLSGGVNDVRIGGLFTTQTAFVLRVVFDGEAKLEISSRRSSCCATSTTTPGAPSILSSANIVCGELVPRAKLVRRRVPDRGDAAERIAAANGVNWLSGAIASTARRCASARGEQHALFRRPSDGVGAARAHRDDEDVGAGSGGRRHTELDRFIGRADDDRVGEAEERAPEDTCTERVERKVSLLERGRQIGRGEEIAWLESEIEQALS